MQKDSQWPFLISFTHSTFGDNMVKLCLQSNSSDALFVSCSCVLLTAYCLCAPNTFIFPSNTMLLLNVSPVCRITQNVMFVAGTFSPYWQILIMWIICSCRYDRSYSFTVISYLALLAKAPCLLLCVPTLNACILWTSNVRHRLAEQNFFYLLSKVFTLFCKHRQVVSAP